MSSAKCNSTPGIVRLLGLLACRLLESMEKRRKKERNLKAECTKGTRDSVSRSSSPQIAKFSGEPQDGDEDERTVSQLPQPRMTFISWSYWVEEAEICAAQACADRRVDVFLFFGRQRENCSLSHSARKTFTMADVCVVDVSASGHAWRITPRVD